MVMKLNFKLAALATAVLLTLNATAETIRYQATPGSKVTLEGTSTIHDWTVEGGILAGFIELDSNFPLDPSKPSEGLEVTPKVEVSVPVRSLKSGKTLMNDIMHDALKVKNHASIKYTLKELKARPRKAGDPLKFDATGDLTVAGVTKPIKMEVTMEPMAGNKLKSSGVTEVKMTDFGISPPAPAIGLGLIKTADEVKITFEWVTRRRDAKQASAN